MHGLLHSDLIVICDTGDQNHATGTSPGIMHPIGSLAQALLDGATTPLKPN